MTSIDYNARAELFLGSDRATALAQGPRNFRTAAQALRFAYEQAAPVSLRGASLRIGTQNFSGADMARLYHSPDYPLSHPVAAAPRRRRRMPFYGASLSQAA